MTELPVVAVMALALLHEEPMHPYEIFRTLEQRCETRLARVTVGSVYHAVERLAADGLVEAVGTEREGRRPERTTYRATAAGTEAVLPRLVGLLADDHAEYPLFPVGLAEAPHLPRAVALTALRARRDRRARTLATVRGVLARCEEKGLPLRYVLDSDYEATMLVAEVAWLDDAIRRLEADPAPWDADRAPAASASSAALAASAPPAASTPQVPSAPPVTVGAPAHPAP